MERGKGVRTSAQVILAAAGDKAAAQVRDYFQTAGFETGPLVGISFSVTAPPEHFARTLQAPVGSTPSHADVELDRAVLPPEIQPLVAAVVFPGAPDFGPGGRY